MIELIMRAVNLVKRGSERGNSSSVEEVVETTTGDNSGS